MKRNNYIEWDKYFMGVSLLSAMRSKDPNTQVGACIVNQRKRIVGIGYNGLPYGCDDDEFPWNNTGEFLDAKYPYVVHAEANAILNSTTDLSNCTIYTSLFPCNECVKLIIQSGIKEIVFQCEKYNGTPSDIAAKKMLDAANVKYRKIANFSLSVKDEN
jgi:dCMP deaminase